MCCCCKNCCCECNKKVKLVYRQSDPSEYFPKIGEMKEGDIGYVVPWAVRGKNINTTFSVEAVKRGTVELRILKLGFDEFRLLNRHEFPDRHNMTSEIVYGKKGQ